MDKSCANHPESMALATCKACEKSICLMCVVDEKEGTFCSTECHSAFVEGREVPKYIESAPAAEPASVASSGAQKIESIFDDGPSASPAASSSEGMGLPPSDDPMPIVAEGTKWRSIGAQCQNHSDTPAVANCDRCGKAVCALCLLEASQGTFCSSDCMNAVVQQAPAPVSKGRSSRASQPAAATAEQAALQGKPVFRFKEPPRRSKAGLMAGLVVFAAILAVGGYYGWKVFSPETVVDSRPKIANNTDPEAVRPVDPRPVDPRPVDPRPVDPKPVDPPPVPKNPDPVVRTPDAEPPRTGILLRPRPIPKAVPTRTLNPWSEEKPGSWYRLKTIADGKTTYTDIGLKEKTSGSYVLAIQSSGEGQPSEKKVEAPVVYLRGEQTLSIGSESFLCEVQTRTLDAGAPKAIVLISSKYPGAVLKNEASGAVFSATKVWEYSMRVKGRSFDCLVVEGMADKKPVKSYYAALPIGMIRQEKPGESTVMIDFGDDWTKRPAFPN